MLLVVLMIGMAAALLVYGMVDTTSIALRRDKDTAAAFAEAKGALIGRAVADDNRPGSLPCPDTDNDGSAEIFSGADCPGNLPGSNVYVGRLPWRTLGLPDLRDASGERLWYAVLREFARNPTCAPSCPINSDTKGALTVYLDSPPTSLTTEAVAVIFAAGAPLEAQSRSTSATALCPTTGTTIAQNLCAANYLDSMGTINNATPTANPPLAPAPSFISAPTSYIPPPGFNDKVMVITTADLMPVVEQRVARELLALLQSYRAASSVPFFPSDPQTPCNCYTWADNDNNNEGDNDAFRGWLPLGEGDPHDWSVTPPSPAGLGIVVPAWLHQNNWWQVIYYAVAPDETQNKSGGTLWVDAIPGTHVVLITPGPAPPGVPRPVSPPGTPAYWAEYLEPGNADHSDNNYVRPSSSAYARNRLYTIP